MQHGKPDRVIERRSTGSPRGTGRARWVAERLVVPLKPGNAGGGKGPQFKGNARRGEVQEIGQPINSG